MHKLSQTRLLLALMLASLSVASHAQLPHSTTMQNNDSAPSQQHVSKEIKQRSTAIVLDFENGTDAKVRKSVRKQLAEKFVQRLHEQEAFDKVFNERDAKKQRRIRNDSSVVVAGVITSYRKKSANVRVLVGVDEGISFFDTRIRLSKKASTDILKRSKVNAITVAEDELLAEAKDKGESLREYVEDAAQAIARAYRSDSKARKQNEVST
ncbi:MAG: DUF4410 domain-containing protein [Pseudomonadales bacterium]